MSSRMPGESGASSRMISCVNCARCFVASVRKANMCQICGFRARSLHHFNRGLVGPICGLFLDPGQKHWFHRMFEFPHVKEQWRTRNSMEVLCLCQRNGGMRLL